MRFLDAIPRRRHRVGKVRGEGRQSHLLRRLLALALADQVKVHRQLLRQADRVDVEFATPLASVFRAGGDLYRDFVANLWDVSETPTKRQRNVNKTPTKHRQNTNKT